MDHSEIFGDVIFQKLDHSSKLHAGLLLSSETPESLEEWNSGNEPSAQSQLMRCRSVPVIQEAFSLKMPLCPSQSRHRPELLWHRSSFGSNDSVESAIQDDGDDEDEEMIVSPASAEHPVKMSHYQHPFIRANHRTNVNLLSSSLPASMSRTPTQECATRELLQLTQPLREGVLSRERLLPATRMKQVGVGGRGKRHASSTALVQHLPLPSLGTFPDPSIRSSHPIPLLAPRPIRAWQPERS